MSFYLTIFLPCVLGLFIYYILTNEKRYFDLGLVYFVNVLLTNLLNIGILYFKDESYYSLITRLEGDYRFAFKYMLLATAIGVVLGIFSAIIKKYFSVYNLSHICYKKGCHPRHPRHPKPKMAVPVPLLPLPFPSDFG